jgi:hypothetical protein
MTWKDEVYGEFFVCNFVLHKSTGFDATAAIVPDKQPAVTLRINFIVACLSSVTTRFKIFFIGPYAPRFMKENFFNIFLN